MSEHLATIRQYVKKGMFKVQHRSSIVFKDRFFFEEEEEEEVFCAHQGCIYLTKIQ